MANSMNKEQVKISSFERGGSCPALLNDKDKLDKFLRGQRQRLKKFQ